MYSSVANLSSQSRLWIYQCNREFSGEEEKIIDADTKLFLENWTAHNNNLLAGYEIRYHRFLILMVDENVAGASGCSIDKSFHFIQSLEKKLNCTLLDRMIFTYKKNDSVKAVTRQEFERLFSIGEINVDTTVFNNLVQVKGDLENAWEIPLGKSWHRQLMNS